MLNNNFSSAVHIIFFQLHGRNQLQLLFLYFPIKCVYDLVIYYAAVKVD